MDPFPYLAVAVEAQGLLEEGHEEGGWCCPAAAGWLRRIVGRKEGQQKAGS